MSNETEKQITDKLKIMAKIWDKGFEADKLVNDFTVGKDRELDLRLAKHDIKGSMAHIKMLVKIGLLEKYEEKSLKSELQKIMAEVESGNFSLDDIIYLIAKIVN